MNAKLAVAVVAAGLAGGALASPVSADPGVGRPFEPSCVGRTTAFYVQAYGGAANAAATFGFTVPEAHNVVRGFLCGRTVGIVPTP